MATRKSNTKIELKIGVLSISDSCFAMTTIGGIQVRGSRADNPTLAVQALFQRLANDRDEIFLGIELALEGRNVDSILKELGNGSNGEGS